MSLPRVLLMEPLHAVARARLDEFASVVELGSPGESLEGKHADGIVGLITRGRGCVDGALLSLLGGLRVVSRAGVGLDNVDLAACEARGVWVLNVPDALTETVAEHALALALAARRQIPAFAAAARDGDWDARSHYAGDTVAGARTAILGLGAIGTRAARLFDALGADVVTWSRTPRDAKGFEPDLERALQGASIVSLHIALHAETRGLLSCTRLSRLADGATIVNTARPSVVDRSAMLAALDSGKVGAYAVDGFDPEPPDAADQLLRHPRVIVTPHVAALTQDTFRDLCLQTVGGVRDALAGRAPSGGARRVV